jgi:serine/threonine-protein kinase RsbW
MARCNATSSGSTVPAAQADRLVLNIDSDPANLADARKAVEAFCHRRGMPKAATDCVGLCVNEALANVIRHAYAGATDRPIELSAEDAGDAVRVRVRDWGSGQLPPEPPVRKDPLKPGGLGLVCMVRMLDDAVYEPQPGGGMLLTMTKRK